MGLIQAIFGTYSEREIKKLERERQLDWEKNVSFFWGWCSCRFCCA